VIVGRSAVLERFDRLIGRLADGQGDRLLVVGDPGIGKTALLDVVQRRCATRGVRVVHVRGADGEDDLGFALLDDLHRVLGLPDACAGQGVGRRADTLVHALVDATASGPLLLVVDDAQFADDASLATLGLAVERADDLALLTLVATRPDADALARLARWPTLHLDPLDDEAALALLRSVLGLGFPANVLAELVAELGGNPLALREAPLLLRREELLGDHRLPDPMPVVPRLAEAWGRVLDRLPAATEQALIDLAVAGSRSDVYSALRPAGRATEDLEPAIATGLVTLTSSSGPAFAHPLVRETVLHRAGATRVRDRHTAAARIARDRGLPAAVRLHHLVRSALGPDPFLAAELAGTAEAAEAADRIQDAVTAWEASARFSTSTRDRVERASRGIGLLIRTGIEAPQVHDLLDHVAEADLDPETGAWVTALRATIACQEDPSSALTALRTAVDHARVAAPNLVPGLLWEVAATAWLQGLPDEGRCAAEELACVAHGRDDPHLCFVATALRAAAAFQSGEVARSVPLRRAAACYADSVDPVTAELTVLFDVVAIDDLLLDQGAGAGHRLLVLSERMAAEAEPRVCLWGMRAWRARAQGDLDEAGRLVVSGRRLVEALRRPTGSAAVDTHAGLTALSIEIASIVGDAQVLRDEMPALRAVTEHMHDRRRRATGDRAVGLSALVAGRLEEAAASLSAAADVDFLGRGLRDAVLPARVDLVEVCLRLHRRDEATSRADAVRPLLDDMDEPAAAALSERAAALVAADPDEAMRHFAAAVALHGDGLDPFEHGRTLLLRAEHLRRHHQRADARACLQGAAVQFERLWARPWLERVQVELRAAGGTSGTAVPVVDLTPQELAVAREVASGRSNREVAEALYLSSRTVEYHLGNVYRKLGVHGRAGLARTFVDGDTVDLRR